MAEPTAPGPAALRRGPLDHLTGALRAATVTGPRAVALAELPCRTMTALRAAPDGPAAARRAEVLGAPLPTRCGDTARGEHGTALWLGPDEWLLVAEDGAPAPLDALSAALGGDPGQVVDVSAQRTVLELHGPSARGVLEKGCAPDLHPRAFPPGRAVSTAAGQVPLVLWHPAADTYRLLPRASFADHLAHWLMDAMGEYGLPEVD
ncbi:sarcosine oxidase subunit gamma [Streptomyces benahoarensis]|uniref:Sarcosine oxidase subunit gamma family protein n=1 Tax=Streptomyces benahoarensis TaxID=2595054 RepID=A0A553ZA46_9ACTN|nr:sarcosine oxidase subunit gamma family protein [Streptomyces benahoarensis]TSB38309.1 sarcosine oxidase subunit gamma family protein [Streptomyces benahoarensis]